ncbi:GNAT family N-acetyltransferase [Nonomuraea jiangxiensis]|uniref:N-acetyltransferase domain-containing protein n=1 Tax=Nonomuraea jiangxiensis TaxID=633440 RepID=A0A1G8P3F4_9ACTN|nr:GNAT family N-acetyltransferase [Nonomuraea jiangxiensis]SDI87023.1 hypothetical protein SAMN05421869_107316 [Nonomuraea jiangxiensis]
MATYEPFVPRSATEDDLAAWCTVFSEGQSEMSGDPPLASALAERLLAEEEAPPVLRWAARADGARPITGVAELRPQPHDPRVGFLRLFVAAPARRNGIGSALPARIAGDARSTGMDRIQALASAGEPGEAFAGTWPGVREMAARAWDRAAVRAWEARMSQPAERADAGREPGRGLPDGR